MKPLMNGRVAVVTGASSGLGLETARLLSAEGSSVVLVDVNEERGKEASARLNEAGGRTIFFAADVSSRDSMMAAVGCAEDTYGHLDTVVANAGILGEASFRGVDSVSQAAWDEILGVNLTGTFNSIVAALPALRRAGGGTISVTSSVAGQYGVLYAAAYSATKGGINALVRSLSVELSPENIRINSLCVGSMRSNLGETLGAGRTRETVEIDRPDKTWKSRVIDGTRDGAAEAARVHLFLNSELSRYINGESITVDGGFSVWNGM